MKLKRGLSLSLTLVMAVALLQSCAWKKSSPNISIITGIKADTSGLSLTEIQLVDLYNLDPQLAMEMGRLTEFQQEAVSQVSLKALTKFVAMVRGASKNEINNLKIVIDEGVPEVRKYSAPLQAIIWLLQNEDLSAKNTDIFSFSLFEIISSAWNFQDHHWEGKGLEEITDRLSSPKLIGYYVRHNFIYHSKLEYPSTAQDFWSIFKHKRGNCQGYADFQCMALKKAGYVAGMIKVKGMYGSPYHVVVEFVDKDEVTYVIDNTFVMFVDPYGITEKEQYVSMLPQIGRGKN